MSQKNIDFGSFPDDPSADAIRTAFEKTQYNFDQLFQGLAGGTVLSINKTPGAGISVNSPTGDIVISADFAQLQIHTSTLSLGIGSNGTHDVTINNSSQLLYIDLPQTISNVVNMNLSGNLTTGNINANSVLTSNLTVSNLASFNNINSTGNISAAGNVTASAISSNSGIVTGTLVAGNMSTVGNVSAGNLNATSNIQSTNLIVTNIVANAVTANVANLDNLNATSNVTTNNLNSNNVFTTNLINGTSNIIIGNNGNISVSPQGSSNIFVVSSTGATIQNQLSVAGNVIAQYLVGNVTGNFSGNIIAPGSNTQLIFNDNSSFGASSQLTFDKATNVLNILGNATIGNINATNQSLSGNLLVGSGVGGTISGANLISASYLTGILTTANQPNITSLGNLNNLVVTGNSNLTTINSNTINVNGSIYSNNANLGNLAVANYFRGDGSLLTNLTIAAGSTLVNGSSNVIVTPSGNVNTSINGTSNILSVSTAGINVIGNISATGNISSPIMNATFYYGNLSGDVVKAAQPSITSLGTLTGLNVNGVANLGSVSNIKITGGSTNYYLTTDGSGGLSWTSGAFSPTGGSNTAIQYNDNGNFAGDSNFTYDKNSRVLTLNGNINTSNANLGNLIVGNFIQGTLITASQPNITSVGSLTSLIVTGNINSANVFGGNTVSANFLNGTLTTGPQPNITSTGTLSTLSVTGNANVSNIGAINGVFTNILGNGSSLSSITGANVTGTVANATYATSAGSATTATSATTAGTVTTAAQPNITSVGTLTSLSVSGNANVGNLGAVDGVFTSNVQVGSGSGGNITGANLISANLFTGTLTTNAQPNITSVGTLTSITSSGNITGANIITNNYVIRSVSIGISANGSNQATATLLNKEINIISVVSSGQGISLPDPIPGMVITVTNTSANSLLVYPFTGDQINTLGINVPFTQAAGSTLQFISPTTTQWYTVGATYA